jgi:hypothetical protein
MIMTGGTPKGFVPKKVGRFQVLVGRPAASPIGLFLLLYGSLFLFLIGLLSPAMEQLI